MNHDPANHGLPAGESPPRKKSPLLWILLGAVGGAGAVVAICCGSCGLLGYGASASLERQVSARFSRFPAIVENIGTIETIERNYSKAFDLERAQVDTGDDSHIIAFDVQGDRGEGTIIWKQRELGISPEKMKFEWAVLQVKGKHQIPLKE